MAGSEVDESDGGDKNDEKDELNKQITADIVFKCCKKKASTLVCTICFAIFHTSCAARNSGLFKKKSDGVKVICGNCTSAVSEVSEDYQQKICKLIEEISWKNRLIDEITDKNDVLKESNRILKENNALLIEKISRQQQQQKTITTFQYETGSTDDELQSTAQAQNKTTDVDLTAGVSTSSTEPATVVANQEIGNGAGRERELSTESAASAPERQYSSVVKQTHLRIFEHAPDDAGNSDSARVIHGNNRRLGNGSFRSSSHWYRKTGATNKQREYAYDRQPSYASSGTEPDDGFKYQKKRGFKKRLGRGEVAQGGESFVGEDRRLWIYINRVKRTADVNTVREYIKNKPGFDRADVLVKEIPSHPNQLKRFLVVGPMDRKEDFYDPAFWPRNIGIKRFSFERHKDFLATLNFHK